MTAAGTPLHGELAPLRVGPLTVLDALANRPDAPGIVLAEGVHGPATRLERRELLDAALSFGAQLRQLGLEPGDRVLLVLPTGRALLVGLLGTWFAGGVAVLAAPAGSLGRASLLKEKLIQTLALVRPRLVFVQARSTLEGVPLPPQTQVLGPDELGTTRAGPGALHLPRPDDVALLQLTSGTTGASRATVLRHRHLTANLEGIGQTVSVRADDVVLSWLPLHHDMGLVGGLLFPLYHRLGLQLLPTEAFGLRPDRWLRTISETRATLSPAPCFAYEVLARRVADARLRGLDLSSWRYGWVGAEPVFVPALDDFQRRFEPYGLRPEVLHPAYGLAEATLCVSSGRAGTRYAQDRVQLEALRSRGVAEPADEGTAGAVTLADCGPPLKGMEVRVATPSGEVLPARHEGRVWVRGPSVSEGYFGEEPRDGEWLDTGDLGYVDGERLFITGRVKDLIIRGGVNFHPQQLERAAARVKGVRAGCVAAFSGSSPGSPEEVVVVAETRLGSVNARKALAQAVTRELAESCGIQAQRVELVGPGAIPKTSSGKVQRALCRRLLETNQLRRRETGHLRRWLFRLGLFFRGLWR